MPDLPPQRRLHTHEVTNQPEPRGARDYWGEDAVLRGAALGAGAREAALSRAGAALGTEAMLHHAAEARRDKPRLVAFGRDGARRDEVAFSAGYHAIMGEASSLGYAAMAWDGAPGGHASHAAMVYMLSQLEPGICCPLTMTYAAYPALAADPALAAEWQPRLASGVYDPSIAPVSAKRGATMGMAMTEKQGGSDVRANTTRAEPDGNAWRLTGHKWFCSAPMSDGFLTLAQAEAGLTCFLVPRWLEGGRNAIRLMRLKDKLGNHANASAEIEYDGALAHALGAPGQGVRTIIEMVHHTRLDTAIAPAGLMRAALAEAQWWVAGRVAFQRRLIDQPLMRAVLADLALDAEGATALGFAVAAAFDGGAPEDRAFARIGVALAKYLSNKRAPTVIGEAMEVLGGMGYVEETPLPMLYREAPLNGIWEGSGNVICLDILRSLAREPAAGEALRARLQGARGGDARYDAALAAHEARWPGLPEEGEARLFAERTATLLTAAILLESAPSGVAESYVAGRVDGDRGLTPGAVAGLDTDTLLDRLAPS